jgi:3-polyprenyl-4-hydroxybenzoate decarboxylase
MARLAGQYPHLSFVVKAASVSTSQTIQKAVPVDSQVHIEFIKKMIEAKIDVQPLEIFTAVWKKLLEVARAAEAGKVRLRNGSLAEEVASARQLLDSSLAETQRVKELIAEAKRQVAAERGR